VMMRTNWDRLARIAAVAASYGAMFRVNVYQPVTTDAFTLTYEQFWEGFRLLFASTKVVSCSEPLVNAVAGMHTTRGCPCGTTSVRVSPRREVTPCPYWPEKALTIRDLQGLGGAVTSSPAFARTRVVPAACRGCRFEMTCGGGCASRRALRGALDSPDEYCPVVRGDHIDLPYTPADPEDVPKAGNACSTAVIA
jgi:radical SAM protein with 4Fe4S-binding SPASM domain